MKEIIIGILIASSVLNFFLIVDAVVARHLSKKMNEEVRKKVLL